MHRTEQREVNNIGLIDRILRAIIGAGLYSLGYFLTDAWEYIAILGPFVVLTAIFGISPIYLLFRLSTKQTLKSKKMP